MREALFSRWGERLQGATFLDLYAGSGVVGIEALSRGAAWCGFVDEHAQSLRLVEHNLRHCGAAPGAAAVLRRVLPEGASRLPADWPPRIGLVFADPPYAFRRHGALLASVSSLLSPEGELVVEHSARVEVSPTPELELHEQRRYGDTKLSFLRLA